MSKAFSLVLALFMIFGGTARAIAAEKPIELNFLNFSSNEDYTQSNLSKVIANFEKENPDIKIKSASIGVGEIRSQLVMMMMGGNPPDVAQLHIGDAVTVYTMGALYSAEELYDKAFIDNLNPKFYDESLYEGKHAAVVWSPNTLAFMYNKKLLKRLGYDAPPKTLDEVDAMMKKGKARIPELIGIQLDTTIRAVGFSHMWNFMNLFEYEPIKGKTVKFNSPNMIKYAEWLRRTVKEGYTLPGKRFGEFRPMAAQGRVLFCIEGTSHRSQLQAKDKNITDQEYYDTWGVIPFPTGPSGKHVASPDDHSLVVLRSTKHKKAAAKFVEYLVANQEALRQYQSVCGFLPTTKDYETVTPGSFDDPTRNSIMEYAAPYIVNPPYGPNYVKAATLAMTAVQEIITSDRPVKDILDSCQAKLEGILQ